MTMASASYQIAVVFLHPGCNMTCTFCITENTMDTMSFEQAQYALTCIRKRSITNVVLGGGEPFAWPSDTIRLATWAKSQGFFVQVGTNGIAMPDEPNRVEGIDRYVLPLDSADASIHNQLRRYGKGHHKLILDRMELLRRLQRSVTVSTVVTSHNFAHLSTLGDFLSMYVHGGGKLHAWHLYKFIPEGRGGHAHKDELAVSDDAYDDVCARAKRAHSGFRVYKRKDMRHSRSVDFFWYERGALRMGSEVW